MNVAISNIKPVVTVAEFITNGIITMSGIFVLSGVQLSINFIKEEGLEIF